MWESLSESQKTGEGRETDNLLEMSSQLGITLMD